MNKGRYKKLFYGLLLFNVLVVLVIISLVFWPAAEGPPRPSQERPAVESSEFTIRTTKQNLNELVNGYLDQALKGSRHQYHISLEEDVHLIGELPVFSTTVPLSVHFEPIVQDNGDLVLKLTSISLGLLELPNQRIMGYMDDHLPMPSWVTVRPKQEEIYIAVTEMNLRSNFQVEVEHIDLEANHLSFKLHVPYRSLGIDMMEP
ncbi:YpmS family protein [Virgibacillus xinjiangensis]|uniref:YpmS family protein n=1 Tax=Virgibacillus xinjiangensis TaxID=393090 RepID=A0ABV7CTW5_9BACI